MAAVEPSEWHQVEVDINEPRIIPNTGDPRPIPRFVRFHRPFAYLEDTIFGRPYAEQLAAFLEGGSVRLAPPTGMVPRF